MKVAEEQVNALPEVFNDIPLHFCPGCHHGIIHRLVAECLCEHDLFKKTICASSVGCSVFIYDYIKVDTIESPHGRAAAVATGVKRASPDKVVFTYQGDGDLAAIGLSEIIYAANRGEQVTVIFVNNTVYGMTGGQMAPTTMISQKTTTSPAGRLMEKDGAPLKMAEMMASLPGCIYSARVAVNSIKAIKRAQKSLSKAFIYPLQNRGLGFIEFLSACPTNWRMTPLAANKRIDQEMTDYFPLGEFKDSQNTEKV